MSERVLLDDGVVRTETAAYPWHGEAAAPPAGELTKQYGNTRYEQTRAGGRVGVADWESVSVVSDLDKSLKQDASEMHGLNSKLARYMRFTSSLEQSNKELHEQLMALRAEHQQMRLDAESRPTGQRYDALMAERDELHRRLRELMAQLQQLGKEKAAWGRDASRAALLEQELQMLRVQQGEADDHLAGNRDEIDSLERALAAALEGQRAAEEQLRSLGYEAGGYEAGGGGQGYGAGAPSGQGFGASVEASHGAGGWGGAHGLGPGGGAVLSDDEINQLRPAELLVALEARGYPTDRTGLQTQLAKRGLPTDAPEGLPHDELLLLLMVRLLMANEHDRVLGRPTGISPQPKAGSHMAHGAYGAGVQDGTVRQEVADLERETALLKQQSELEAGFQTKLAKQGDAIRAAMQAELALANSSKGEAADRNKALLDSLEALTKRNAELEGRIMEMNKRDLERLRDLEAMAAARDDEIMMLRKQLVQARKDVDDAIAAKNLLEMEIAGYERLLSGADSKGGAEGGGFRFGALGGRALGGKTATGGVAKGGEFGSGGVYVDGGGGGGGGGVGVGDGFGSAAYTGDFAEDEPTVARFPWHADGGADGASFSRAGGSSRALLGGARGVGDAGLQAIYRDVSRGLKDIYFKDRAPTAAGGAGSGGGAGGDPYLYVPAADDAAARVAGGGGGEVSASMPSDLSALAEFKLLTDEGPVVVRARANGTAAYLKEMVSAQLCLSPRLRLTLSQGWAPSQGGEALRDDAIIAPFATGAAKAGGGAAGKEPQLLLSAAPRPLSDFVPGTPGVQPLSQIRVRTAQRGQAYGPAMVIKPVSWSTTVAQVKATLLANARHFPGIPSEPSKLTLYFSPVFITADVLLGRKQRAALADADSLGACQVIHDDIVYLEFQK